MLTLIEIDSYRIWDHVCNQVETQVSPRVWNQVESQIWLQGCDPLYDRLYAHLEEELNVNSN